MKKKIYISMLCVIIFIVAFTSYYILSEKNNVKENENFELTVDENYLICDIAMNVTFSVKTNNFNEKMILYNLTQNEEIGVLYDDGNDNDKTANDGIYTLSVQLTSKCSGSEEYVVKSNSGTSNTIIIYSFEQLTEETALYAKQVAHTIEEKILQIEKEFQNSNDDFLREVSSYLENQKEINNVLLFEKEEDSIYIKLTSGLTIVYEPSKENVSNGGTDITLSFFTYQPNSDIESQDIVKDIKTYNEKLTNCQFQADYSDSAVTLDLIKSFPNNSVILWNGHGGYGPIVKSFLCSGEQFDWSAWWWDTTGYYFDCVTDRIIRRCTNEQKDLVCFTSKFIDTYCNDLSNDLFLLTSCHSVQDSRLANAFLNKGANAVLGFTDTVYTLYCLCICDYTLELMTEVNNDTANYYTLSEALSIAKNEYGTNDLEFGEKYGLKIKDTCAEPKIIGDGNYCLAKLKKDEFFSENSQNDNSLYELNIPHDALKYNNHHYYVFSNICSTWEEAQEYCNSLGGYLAVLNDEEENKNIYHYVQQFGYENAYFGYSDAQEEGNWKWINGEETLYTNWSEGEPNNERDIEHYAMFYYKSPPYEWNDGDFHHGTVNDTPTFICEWDY